MEAAIRDAYLETQVVTATPQRLRLMLIDHALRKLRAAQAAFEGGNQETAFAAVKDCREVVTELIAGIDPDKTPVAKRVLGLYMFVYSTLVEIQFGLDTGRIAELVQVLEEERTTWQLVCEQMPERPVEIAKAAEELAPQRVADGWSAGYQPTTGVVAAPVAMAPLSLEA